MQGYDPSSHLRVSDLLATKFRSIRIHPRKTRPMRASRFHSSITPIIFIIMRPDDELESQQIMQGMHSCPQRKRPLSMVTERSVSVSYTSVISNEHVYIFIPAFKCLNDVIPSLFHGTVRGKLTLTSIDKIHNVF
jgi:hypothetical protein